MPQALHEKWWGSTTGPTAEAHPPGAKGSPYESQLPR